MKYAPFILVMLSLFLSQCEEPIELDLKEKTNSSIAVSGGELFIRTHEALWCIGEATGK